MKISKLFHWLYGFLMLLPVFGVLFKVGYVMLNDNAKDSYNGSYSFLGYVQMDDSQKQELNIFENYTDVNSTLDSHNLLQEDSEWRGNYTLDLSNITMNGYYSVLIPNVSNVIFNGQYLDTCNTITINPNSRFNDSVGTYTTFYNNTNDYDTCYLRFDEVYYTLNLNNSLARINNQSGPCIVSFTKNDSTMRVITSNMYGANLPTTFSLSFLTNNIKTIAYITDTTLSSVFYSSLQEINDTEFFSWAKDSFLVQPIMYIGGLFGITNPHPIFTFMSYWLSISIIWLVFDLVMYLPLLVHRWLDKGVIE